MSIPSPLKLLSRIGTAGRDSPLTGAYYWLPRPHPNGPTWELLTCHDLGVWVGISHRELFPHIVERLAAAWSLEAEPLKRCLADHYTGLLPQNWST